MSEGKDLGATASQSLSVELTSRGFVAPQGIVEQIGHRQDSFFVVRMTRHEFRQTRIGESGCGIRLLARDDGTYDAVRYPALDTQDAATAAATQKGSPEDGS